MGLPIPHLLVSLWILLLLGSWAPAAAQVPEAGSRSTGFAAPDSTQPIRAYRLPAWRWSTWTLRANGQSSYETAEFEPAIPGRDNASQSTLMGQLFLQPRYRGFWESERRQASLQLSPEGAVGRSGGRSVRPDASVNQDQSTLSGALDGQGALRTYVGTRSFLLAAGDLRLEYSQRRFTEDPDRGPERTQTRLNSSVAANLRLGVGLGRVRIVTPVIRALRVRERLRAVDPGATMSDANVQSAARQLARRPGYQAVYDRPDKVFWRDFFERIGGTPRTPFETFYVVDVLREPVGVRREGSDVQIGAIGTYNRRLEREEAEDTLVTRRERERGTVGGVARGRWYRNVSLRHQLGAIAGVTYTHFVGSPGPLDDEVHVEVEGQWLWSLADRFRLDTRLRADLRYQHDPRGRDEFRSRSHYLASSDLLVFVENSLSLTVGADLRYVHDEVRREGNESEFRSGIRFGITYLVSRALQ